MFSKRGGGGHESCKQCYFHLCCTFIQGQLVKRKKNNNIVFYIIYYIHYRDIF